MVNRSSLIMALMRYWSHVEVMLQRTLTAHAHQYTQNTIHLTRRSLDAHKKNYIKNGEQRSRPYSRKGAIVRNQRRHFIGATRLRCLLVLPTYTHNSINDIQASTKVIRDAQSGTTQPECASRQPPIVRRLFKSSRDFGKKKFRTIWVVIGFDGASFAISWPQRTGPMAKYSNRSPFN